MKKIYFLFALIALLAFAPACHHHHHHHHNDGPEVIKLKPQPGNHQSKPSLKPYPKPIQNPLPGKPVPRPR